MSLVRKQFTINESTSFECWIFIIRNTNGIDEFWFKGRDVAEFLDYENPQLAIGDHVHVQWRQEWQNFVTSSDNDVITPSNWLPHTVFISEPGLYALVTRSKKPEAIKFTKWIYEEVVPSLRRTGRYDMAASAAPDEPMDVSTTAATVDVLRRDLEIANLRSQLAKVESESTILLMKEKELQMESKELQLRLMETEKNLQCKLLQAEKEKLELHYRYTFQTDSARQMGRAAIEQSIQRQVLEGKQQILKNIMSDKYRIIRNMDDIDPLKVNHLGIVYDTSKKQYKIIRQQWGTTRNLYDVIQKTRTSEVELLEPMKTKRRINTNVCVMGDMIAVAHGVNIWTNYRRQRAPCLFGLLFSGLSWTTFSLMDEVQLREHYRYFAEDPRKRDITKYTSKVLPFYETLFTALVNEDDCVAKCLFTDIWQLREQLLKFIESTNNYELLETTSMSMSTSQMTTFDELAESALDITEREALEALGKHYSDERDSIILRKICERRQVIKPSTVTRDVNHQLAIQSAEMDASAVAASATATDADHSFEAPSIPRQAYTVQVPDTPQHVTAFDDGVSITSISSSRDEKLSRYFNDLENVRQTNVDKYTK